MAKRNIFFIITTCLLSQKFEERKEEYTSSIYTLLQELQKYKDLPINTHIYIVENNGNRHTFLNDLQKEFSFHPINVIYTNHNQINTPNKGLKELLDFAFLIQQIQTLSDNDIVVKLTGRYRVGIDCTFLHSIYHQYDQYDAFIRSGAFMYPSQKLCERDQYDCLTGIFGIRAGIILKNIDYYIQHLRDYEWVEWVIIMIIQTNIKSDRIKLFDYLGVWIKTIYMNEYQLF
jgi:hypothetical protein